jgi:hypothetical protein
MVTDERPKHDPMHVLVANDGSVPESPADDPHPHPWLGTPTRD